LENPEASFSLYLHVPFCKSKCIYCDFFSVTDFGKENSIVEESIRQTEHFLHALGTTSLETIYVGGGTPSAISRRSLGRLLGAFSGYSVLEWTVEANPESLDEEFVECCARSGATRMSVGVQSNRECRLALLGRPGGVSVNIKALSLLSAWKGEASIDLLAGIPGQEIGELEDDTQAMAGARIGHVSLYSLTVEPNTVLEQRIGRGEIQPNGGEMDEDLWLAGRSALESMGFVNYEISNFARVGKECRHNLRYWRLDPYIGIGPGAVSTLPAAAAAALGGVAEIAARSAPVVRLQNPRDLNAFLAGPKGFWGIEAEPVGGADFLLETLLMGLRLERGIETKEFTRRFGAQFQELFPGMLEEWVERGYAVLDPAFLRLTGNGRMLLNRLLHTLSEIIHGETFPRLEVRYP
jgi:oxygen-independent coproporphyrinogen-3 oxidase